MQMTKMHASDNPRNDPRPNFDLHIEFSERLRGVYVTVLSPGLPTVSQFVTIKLSRNRLKAAREAADGKQISFKNYDMVNRHSTQR
jgi:hypothetical protein